MANDYTKWYRVGYVAVTNGSKSIVGTDTYWLSAGLKAGDMFTTDDGATFFEVDAITDNTHITLKTVYTGVTDSAAKYGIVRFFNATTPAQVASQTADLLNDFRRYVDTDMQSIRGESAYELAVRLGYSGTESEWLASLIGAGQWNVLNDRTNILTIHNAGSHNAFYRGKNLGSELTAAQISAINNGSFLDLYPGDYWSFSNVQYTYTDENEEEQTATWSGAIVIANCDGGASSGSYNPGHHLVVLPMHGMGFFNAPMNDTATTEGGYYESKMRTVYIPRAQAIFEACFGADHLLESVLSVSNAVQNGREVGYVRVRDKCILMNELQAFGANTWAQMGVMKWRFNQFAVFQHYPELANGEYWLRDVVNSSQFARSSSLWCTASYAATTLTGVRPYTCIR